MSGYFITATGTDVGKTFVTALLVKKWRDSGIDAGYYKAALSGAELRDGKWIAGDADYVKRTAALPDSQEELVSYVYKEAVSPHLAARKEGNALELSKVKADFESACKRHEFLFVEGSGGIICPIRYDEECSTARDTTRRNDARNDDAGDTARSTNASENEACNTNARETETGAIPPQKIFLTDIMQAVNLPLVIVTTALLGSINACVLTVEYARAKGLKIRGIIVNRYGESGNMQMEDDNIFMMQELTGLPILAKIKPGDKELNAAPF